MQAPHACPLPPPLPRPLSPAQSCPVQPCPPPSYAVFNLRWDYQIQVGAGGRVAAGCTGKVRGVRAVSHPCWTAWKPRMLPRPLQGLLEAGRAAFIVPTRPALCLPPL